MLAPPKLADLVTRSRSGDDRAADQLYELLYQDLLAEAHRQRLRWRGDLTLDTRSLVHESYLKLVRGDATRWEDRRHFLAVATRAMRQVLINYAEQRRAAKRGGGLPEVTLDADAVSADAVSADVLDLGEALDRLAAVHPRLARVIELRFLAGLSVEESAEALDVSLATIKRDWVLARAWLLDDLQGRHG